MSRVACSWRVLASCVIAFAIPATFVAAQDPATTIINGGMEEVADDGMLAGWQFASQSGGVLQVVSESPYAGERSALIDATESTATDGSPALFANLMQSLDGRAWQGKRLRLRAAVRTADRVADARAQLWMRVDCVDTSGNKRFGAFDNMDARPIRGDEWAPYEIVLPIDGDADRIVVGMFVIGQARAWIDDVTLEEVSDDTPATGTDKKVVRSNRFNFSPVLQKAFAEADQAPRQPFFTPWLLVPLLALLLFVLSHWPPLEPAAHKGEPAKPRRLPGPLPKFAFRFSFAYWLLYCFPEPFVSFIPVWGAQWSAAYQKGFQAFIGWTATTVFRIPGELVPPNGSGDTTSSYLAALVVFTAAMLVALVWSLLDRRETDYRVLKDLLRSYLRFVLALAMFSYGLAKVSWDAGQFPPLDPDRLARTWGESSPMGVVWSFMGASRAYTVFAGAGELIGGFLLLFRRTTTLGAVVVTGVMTNVLMLNYCYDIPVKLYSTHLVVMALYLIGFDAGRLLGVFFSNRPTESVVLRPPYTNSRTIWVQRAIKAAILVIAFAIPCGEHVYRQVKFLSAAARQPEFFGRYNVEEFKVDGEPVAPGTGGPDAWKKVSFQTLGYNQQFDIRPTYWINVELVQGARAAGCFLWSESHVIELEEASRATFPADNLHVRQVSDDELQLTGESPAGMLEIHLRRVPDSSSLLMSRGYRWISEVPFNR